MARHFVSGSSQRLEVPNQASLAVGAGDFTACVWHRNNGTWPASRICGKGGGGGTSAIWKVDKDGGTKLGFLIDDGNNKIEAVANTVPELEDGSYHLFIFEKWTTPGPTTNVAIYRDGDNLIASNTSLQVTGSLDNTDPLILGAGLDGNPTRKLFWTGDLATFAVFKRRLVGTERSMLVHASPLFLRPDVYFTLNGRDTPEIDVAAGNLGTLFNGPTFAIGPILLRPASLLASVVSTRDEALQGTLAGAGSLTGRLASSAPLGGAAVSAVCLVTGVLGSAVSLQGDVLALSSFAGDLTASVPLAGVVNGASAVSGETIAEVSMSGAVAALTTADANAVATVPISGNVVSGSGTTASVRLLAETPLKGTIDAQSSLSGPLIAEVPLRATLGPTASIAATARAAVPLSAAINESSSAEGALSAAVPCSATTAGISNADAALGAAVPIEGEGLVAQSAAAAVVSAAVPLAASVASVSSASANSVNIDARLSGQVPTTAGALGSLVADVPLAGELVAGLCTIAGDLSLRVPLAGSITASTTIAGQLPVAAKLVSMVAGSSSLTAGDPLLADVPLFAAVQPVFTPSARLRILGEILTTSVGGRVRAITSTGGRVLQRGGS